MPKAFYEILEIKEDASENDIKKAYHKLARKYHPDRNPNGKAQFEKINLAYNVLSDKEKRSQYDKGLINDEGKDIAEARREEEGAKAAANYEKLRRQQEARVARHTNPKPEQQQPSTSSRRQNSTSGHQTNPQASSQQQGPHVRGTRPQAQNAEARQQARPQKNQPAQAANVQQRQTTPRPAPSTIPRQSNAQRAPSRNRLFSHSSSVSCYIFYAESSFSNVQFSQTRAVFVYKTTSSIGILHNIMKNVIAAQHLDKDIELSHRPANKDQPEHAFFNAQEQLAEKLISRLAELITLDLIEKISPVLEEENRPSYGRR